MHEELKSLTELAGDAQRVPLQRQGVRFDVGESGRAAAGQRVGLHGDGTAEAGQFARQRRVEDDRFLGPLQRIGRQSVGLVEGAHDHGRLPFEAREGEQLGELGRRGGPLLGCTRGAAQSVLNQVGERLLVIQGPGRVVPIGAMVAGGRVFALR
jgi:hypothetical protein